MATSCLVRDLHDVLYRWGSGQGGGADSLEAPRDEHSMLSLLHDRAMPVRTHACEQTYANLMGCLGRVLALPTQQLP